MRMLIAIAMLGALFGTAQAASCDLTLENSFWNKVQSTYQSKRFSLLQSGQTKGERKLLYWMVMDPSMQKNQYRKAYVATIGDLMRTLPMLGEPLNCYEGVILEVISGKGHSVSLRVYNDGKQSFLAYATDLSKRIPEFKLEYARALGF
ncbi:MAG: hypothetical protein HWE20_13475 [Gammaproteobacteria bacterium]|nr:hypothetical protein [Gammaproteobacteria bacterium]